MKNKKQHIAPTYYNFLRYFELCAADTQESYLSILRQQPRPDTLCGEDVPANLNHITYGQLDDMRDLSDADTQSTDLVAAFAEILFGHPMNVYDEDVNAVFGFVNFCVSEITRINTLFSSIQPSYSQEERAAGVESLSFGSFGILDWYARRMGLTDHNEVCSVPWVRIYQCMKNDHAQQEYERRLHSQYTKKTKK